MTFFFPPELKASVSHFSPYFCLRANITTVVKMVAVQKATGLSVWKGKLKHYQRNVWICWNSHLSLWGADNLSNNNGNNADKMEYCISKCMQYYMISKWLSPETICHIGTVPATLLLPDCFSTASWHPYSHSGEQFCFFSSLLAGRSSA